MKFPEVRCPLDGKRKAVALFIVALLFYVLLISFFYSIGFGANIVHDVSDDSVRTHPDIPFYQNRTSAILDGQVPYLDFYTESPPLIMYLMIPAALMGNSLLAYSVMFTAYVFIAALAMYLMLRREEETAALRVAAIYLFNPITWTTATVFIQDETIVALFFVLPILLLLCNRKCWGACAAVLGTMTKIFSAVLVPMVLLRQRGKDLLKTLAVTAATFLAISLPFIVLAGEDFVFFFTYYLSQSGEGGMVEGISIWRFLHNAGLSVPGIVLQSLFVIGSLLALWIIYRKNIDPVRGGLLLLMPFFLFFPKIFTCYFIIPFAVACVLSVKDRLPWMLITVGASLAFLCQFFESFDGQPSILPSQGLWVLIPIALSLIVHAIWAFITWRMLEDTEDDATGNPLFPDTRPRSDP